VSRNIKTVLAVSVLFGASTGIYEFVLPYYLDERGLSFERMGTVFAVAAAGTLAVRIIMGRLADVWGRKLFYSLSLGGSGAAMWLTPFSGSVLGQSCLKTIREAMFLTRETLHPVILYEESRGRFMDFMGKTRGMEFLFQGAGTLLSGALFVALGTGGNLQLAGGMLVAGLVFFSLLFKEQWHPRARVASGGLRDLFSFDMHRNLQVITISVFIFNVGLTTSHCFIMPLFFSEKFGASAYTVSWVMVGHRLTIALPLLIAGSLAIRNLKWTYIWTLALEGVVLSASAVIPNFYASAAVWLLHDLLGAGIWIPIQNMLIQEYTRPSQRALEVGKLLAFGGLGAILGPFIAGYLAQRVNVSAPFFVSGILMVAAAGALIWLRPAPPVGDDE
jgi:MFS family permease